MSSVNSVVTNEELVRTGGLDNNILVPTPPSVRQSTIRTSHVAVLKPQEAVPTQTLPENSRTNEFPNFSSRPVSIKTRLVSIQSERPETEQARTETLKGRLAILTTLRPELITKVNPNKFRSSTTRKIVRKKGRLKIRPTTNPTRSNFHPIPSGPVTVSSMLPQARPNVPVSENEFQAVPSRTPRTPTKQLIEDNLKTMSKTSIIANDNNGVWFIEENVNKTDSEPPRKREFIDGTTGLKTSVNPVVTSVPRTWSPAIKNAVSVMETSKVGELKDNRNVKESVTYSTSRVEVFTSVTPSTFKESTRPTMGKPSKLFSKLKELIKEKENKIKVLNRGLSLNSVDMDSSSSKLESQTSRAEEENELDPQTKALAKKMRARRNKLRERAKALMSAIEDVNESKEPFVVLPTHQVNPKLKIDVDQMFDPDKHPGVKRISVYDFEQMLTKNATISVSDKYKRIEAPAEDNKKSAESRETISRLQDEIAMLTRTLQELRLVPGLSGFEDDEEDIEEYDGGDVRAWNQGLMDQMNAETIVQRSPTNNRLSNIVQLTSTLSPATTVSERTWFTSTPSTTERNANKGKNIKLFMLFYVCESLIMFWCLT